MNKKINQYIVFVAIALVVSCGNRQQQAAVVAEDAAFVQDVPEGWEALFDGNTLNNWEITSFGGEGEPYARNGILTLPMAVSGNSTGIRWAGEPLPVNNFAIYYEARRIEGHDIFGGVTFPYNDEFASFIVGGWAGAVCGLSCIDGQDASSNESTKLIHFTRDRWYSIYLRVTTDSISAAIDDTIQVFNIATAGKRIHPRAGTDARGLSFSTYRTTGQIRNLRLKRL